MAKFSIYVPDDEWGQARAVGGGLNVSQLVQTALRHFIESRTAKPAFARRPPADASALVEAAREKLVAEARSFYEYGYRAGPRMAKDIGWAAIELLANLNWDFSRWIAELEKDPEYNPKFADAYVFLMDALIEEGGHEPGAVWEMGFTDGLRDVWRAVVEGGQPTPDDGTSSDQVAPG